MKANNVLSIYLFFFFWAFMPNKAYSHAITPVTAITQTLPTCIIINQVYLIDAQQLTEISSRHIDGWRKKLEGKCISEQGLLDYADYIRAELIKAGYLTSYLYYPEQTFLFGILQAKIIVGTVSSVVYQNEPREDNLLPHVFPFKPGEALNLWHLEQGLYNLQNTSLLPFQIKLIPDETNENGTQILVIGQHRREFQGILSFESHSIARQVGNTVSHTFIAANPLLRSDFLYSEVSRQLSGSEDTEITSAALFYSLPYHYWLFSVSGGYQENKSVLTGYDMALPLQQYHWFLLLNAEYLLKRTEHSVTSISIGSQTQKSDTFLSDLYLQTQQRYANYIIGEFSHQINFSQGNTLLKLKYKQGTDWFGATAQQITGLRKPQILKISLSTYREVLPFQYQGQFEVQLSRDKLDVLLDQESLVGAGGISGFTGGPQYTDMGDNSLRLENELLWNTPWQQVALYTSLGIGATANDKATFWKENVLLGGRIGAKGQLGRLSYHLFAEMPFWQGNQPVMHDVSSGLHVAYYY